MSVSVAYHHVRCLTIGHVVVTALHTTPRSRESVEEGNETFGGGTPSAMGRAAEPAVLVQRTPARVASGCPPNVLEARVLCLSSCIITPNAIQRVKSYLVERPDVLRARVGFEVLQDHLLYHQALLGPVVGGGGRHGGVCIHSGTATGRRARRYGDGRRARVGNKQGNFFGASQKRFSTSFSDLDLHLLRANCQVTPSS